MDKIKSSIGPTPTGGWGGSGGQGEVVMQFNKEVGTERISRDEMFMEMAEILAKRSTCQRSKVGALVVKDGRPISCGYNGPVSGAPDCSQVGGGCLGAGCDRSIHAELNSILFAARAGISVDGCTLYCTMSPCLKCAQAIVNSGIRRVVFRDWYRDKSGTNFLTINMVQTEQVYGSDGGKIRKWIDNADSYLCPVCGHEVNNPAKFGGVCPYCFSHVD